MVQITGTNLEKEHQRTVDSYYFIITYYRSYEHKQLAHKLAGLLKVI